MLNDVDFIRELVDQHNASDHSYDHFAHLAAARLVESEQLGKRRDGVIEQLFQLVNGPVWAGDVISKSDRNTLYQMGLAVAVCVNAEEGFTGATYFAKTIADKITDIQKGKIAA